MGNVLTSDDEPEERFLEDGFNLESPDADKVINYGTAAPVWQNTKSNSHRSLLNTNTNENQQTTNGGGGGSSSSIDDRGGQQQQSRQSHSADTRRNEGQEVVATAATSSSSSNQRPATNSSSNHNSGTGTTTEDNDDDSDELQQQQQQQEAPKKLSYIQMAKLGYQELINAIIRPPRADYKMEALGPPAFNFCNKRFTRTDFTLRTKRGYNLECSHWEPIDRTADRIPVVIYMHGNSSARLEVIPQLSYLLSLGVAVFSFDFAGSGKSDGEYVSLGYYEREDLSCIVAHLRSTNVVSTIALWGRSMGAATALMFGDRDPSIACMILDSPFADLTQLCEEMVEKARDQGVIVPGMVASLAIRLLQSSVKKQAGFNIKNISPIAHADKCFIPVLFVAGEHDDFIKKHHSEALHAKYAGDKNLIIVEGDHNSPRPKFLFDSATIFLQSCMQIPDDWSLNVPISMNLMCPPWYFDIYEQRAAVRRKQQQQHQTVAKTTAATASNGSVPSTTDVNNNKNPPFTVEMGIPISKAPESSSATVQQQQQQSGVSSSTAATTTTSSSSMNGFDHEEMGMTSERQRVIQASLFKMLGQADDANTTTSSTDTK